MRALTSTTENILRQLRALDPVERACVLGNVLAHILDDNTVALDLPLDGHTTWLAHMVNVMLAASRNIGREEALSIELPADELAARIVGRRGQS
jgi:hypothetical protein